LIVRPENWTNMNNLLTTNFLFKLASFWGIAQVYSNLGKNYKYEFIEYYCYQMMTKLHVIRSNKI